MRIMNPFAIRSLAETFYFSISDSDVLISSASDKILIVYLNKKALQPSDPCSINNDLSTRSGVERACSLLSSHFQGIKLHVVWHPGATSFTQQGSDTITGSKDKLVLIEFALWRKRARVKYGNKITSGPRV